MPPSREGLTKLFVACNLNVNPVKCIDCLLFCRGPKLENSDPEEFDFEKLIAWFIINIRHLKHITLKEVDKDWVEENIMQSDYNSLSLPLPPQRPDPEEFLRKGTGTGGFPLNKIL